MEPRQLNKNLDINKKQVMIGPTYVKVPKEVAIEMLKTMKWLTKTLQEELAQQK